MGNCCTVKDAVDHWIFIKTGDRKGLQTEVSLGLVIHDRDGRKSPEIPLHCYFRNEYERGKSEALPCPPLGSDFGDVVMIEFWRDDNSRTCNWFCEAIIINDRRHLKTFSFPVLRWVRSGVTYKLQLYDTVLPQYDPSIDVRRKELNEMRMLYQYAQVAPNMPVQLKMVSQGILPPDEIFSDESQWSIDAQKVKLMSSLPLPRDFSGKWTELEDLDQLYSKISLPVPTGMQKWSDDIAFGAQRLVGCNPVLIKLCKTLPENMAVTADMLKHLLEGWTLKQVIDAKRLFVVDLAILLDVPTKALSKEEDAEICAPIALFFVTSEKLLFPLAIQLYQGISPDNPVYLPSDHPVTWLLAKLWFNHAEACVHQAVYHYAYTHYILGGIAIAMYRHLTPTHPIYKLLQPHLQFLLAVNDGTIHRLLERKGFVDHVTSIGQQGAFELIRRACEEWRLDIQGNFMKDLATRGVLDQKVLPFYAYRDDASLVHRAIENYVKSVTNYYYKSVEDLLGDEQLQQWVYELALPIEEGGVGLQGIPNHGQIKVDHELQLLCTYVIFTCTAQHNAFVHGQYDAFAYPPKYPLFLYDEPPVDKTPQTTETVMKTLPPKDVSVETMVMMKVLNKATKKTLGESEFTYNWDPQVQKFEHEFREQLKIISDTINERNRHRPDYYKYTALDPANIPNYILS